MKNSLIKKTVDMEEFYFEYMNKAADQILVISSLLGGFTIAVVANLLVYESKSRIIINILKAAAIAAGCFLSSVFAMTKIILITTKGYSSEIVRNDLVFPRNIGFSTFILGLISLSVVISLAGWTKSKSTGIFTTVVGVLTLVAMLSMIA